MKGIPYAKGLTEELLARDINFTIGNLVEEMAPDGIHRSTYYPLFEGERQLGVVEVNSWDANGVTQISHVAYNGVVPGYRDDRNISMVAMAQRTLDRSHREYLDCGDLTKPNNTFENPLYRYDGWELKLADSEVDGLGRFNSLSEEVAMQLEAGWFPERKSL